MKTYTITFLALLDPNSHYLYLSEVGSTYPRSIRIRITNSMFVFSNAWMPRGRSEAPMPNGNWVIMPNGVLNPGDTISVTRTNPHSKTPDTEKATRNLGHYRDIGVRL
jgi:hypothetical protein